MRLEVLSVKWMNIENLRRPIVRMTDVERNWETRSNGRISTGTKTPGRILLPERISLLCRPSGSRKKTARCDVHFQPSYGHRLLISDHMLPVTSCTLVVISYILVGTIADAIVQFRAFTKCSSRASIELKFCMGV